MTKSEKDIVDIIQNCNVLLLDIEGTTTSISFVKDKLFPYAVEHVQGFLEGGWEEDAVKEAVAALRKLAVDDEEQKVEGFIKIPNEDAPKEEQISGIVENVKWQMSADRKSGALKLLQGLIWEQGYDKGEIKGHVYEDVAPALKLWREVEGHQIYIYSSGSVQAQKSLFKYSDAGDLLYLLDGHFDTEVGAKRELQSYNNITEKIGCKADEILFLTDILQEAEAAVSSGLHAVVVVREGNDPQSQHQLPHINNFHQLCTTTTNTSSKRKPDHTEECQPAKVAKISVEDDLKSVSEPEMSENSNAPTNGNVSTNGNSKDEDITMEVTQEAVSKKKEILPVDEMEVDDPEVQENIDDTITEKTAKKILTKNNDEDTEVMPVEESKKTEETAITEEVNEQSIEPENKTEELPEDTVISGEPTVITEIEDVTETSETENLEKVDIIPVIEEPIESVPAPTTDVPNDAEMADILNDEGEALEKECEEILSKVREVTRIDNITTKIPCAILDADETNELAEKPATEEEVTQKGEPEVMSEPAASGENNIEEKVVILELGTEPDLLVEDVEKQKINTDNELVVDAAIHTSTIDASPKTSVSEKSNETSPPEISKDITPPVETIVVDSSVTETPINIISEPVVTLEAIGDMLDNCEEPLKLEEKSTIIEKIVDNNLKSNVEEEIPQEVSMPIVTEPVTIEANPLVSSDEIEVTPAIDTEMTKEQEVEVEDTSDNELAKSLNRNKTEKLEIESLVNGKTTNGDTQTARITESTDSMETELTKTTETADNKETAEHKSTETANDSKTEITKSTETANNMETEITKSTETDDSTKTDIAEDIEIANSRETETTKSTEVDDRMETETPKTDETDNEKFAETANPTESANGTVIEGTKIREGANGIDKTNGPTVKVNGNGDIEDAKRNGTPAEELSRLNGTVEEQMEVGAGEGKVKVVEEVGGGGGGAVEMEG